MTSARGCESDGFQQELNCFSSGLRVITCQAWGSGKAVLCVCVCVCVSVFYGKETTTPAARTDRLSASSF